MKTRKNKQQTRGNRKTAKTATLSKIKRGNLFIPMIRVIFADDNQKKYDNETCRCNKTAFFYRGR